MVRGALPRLPVRGNVVPAPSEPSRNPSPHHQDEVYCGWKANAAAYASSSFCAESTSVSRLEIYNAGLKNAVMLLQLTVLF